MPEGSGVQGAGTGMKVYFFDQSGRHANQTVQTLDGSSTAAIYWSWKKYVPPRKLGQKPLADNHTPESDPRTTSCFF